MVSMSASSRSCSSRYPGRVDSGPLSSMSPISGGLGLLLGGWPENVGSTQADNLRDAPALPVLDTLDAAAAWVDAQQAADFSRAAKLSDQLGIGMLLGGLIGHGAITRHV